MEDSNGIQRTARSIGDTVQDLARKAAGQAVSVGRKYPVRLVTVVTAALAGIMAGRRRRSR